MTTSKHCIRHSFLKTPFTHSTIPPLVLLTSPKARLWISSNPLATNVCAELLIAPATMLAVSSVLLRQSVVELPPVH